MIVILLCKAHRFHQLCTDWDGITLVLRKIDSRHLDFDVLVRAGEKMKKKKRERERSAVKS